MSQTYVFARNAPSAEYDRSLAWAALLLAATGLVMVYSASIATAEASRFTGNNAGWYLARHGVYLGAALVAAISVFLAPVRFWQIGAPWLFAGCVALLAWQHAIVRPGDLSRLDAAFFTANGILALWLLGAAAVDLLALSHA